MAMILSSFTSSYLTQVMTIRLILKFLFVLGKSLPLFEKKVNDRLSLIKDSLEE